MVWPHFDWMRMVLSAQLLLTVLRRHSRPVHVRCLLLRLLHLELMHVLGMTHTALMVEPEIVFLEAALGFKLAEIPALLLIARLLTGLELGH